MNTEKKLPKIALGAWAWGTGAAGGDQVFGLNLGVKDLRPVFEEAMKNKLNLWDTAAVYGMGTSETILGEFVKSVNREDIIISTKFTPQIASDSENAVEEMLEGSFKRLNTDYIDIYWIHNPADVKKWTPKVISLAKSGKIKTIGVSNHNLKELKLVNSILNKEGLKVSAVQNHYSLLNRSSEKAGILEYCKENNITFYSYMVLEQGALSGNYDSKHLFPEGNDRAKSYNPIFTKLDELINKMREIASNHNATVAQIATAWAIGKDTVPILGVTKVKHVTDAATAMNIKLSNEEIKIMENLTDKAEVSTIREWEKEM